MKCSQDKASKQLGFLSIKNYFPSLDCATSIHHIDNFEVLVSRSVFVAFVFYWALCSCMVFYLLINLLILFWMLGLADVCDLAEARGFLVTLMWLSNFSFCSKDINLVNPINSRQYCELNAWSD